MPVVLITGCDGFVGRAVARALSREYAVVGLDGREPQALEPLADFVTTDFSDADSIEAALRYVADRHGGTLASVIHLAAHCDFSGQASPRYRELNVLGTERLLQGLEAFRLDQFVLGSSMLVHAPSEPRSRISECSRIEPRWAYPRSQWQAEQAVRCHESTRNVVLRLALVYDDDCHCPALTRQIQGIYERQLSSHLFPGDATHGRAYVHLEDVVQAFECVLRSRTALDSAETFLIGESTTLSYGELQRAIARILHDEDWVINAIPKLMARAGAWLDEHVPGDHGFVKSPMIDFADDHYELDITRAEARLGWTPLHHLQATLPRMLATLKADPRAWYFENQLEPPARMRRGLGWFGRRAANDTRLTGRNAG